MVDMSFVNCFVLTVVSFIEIDRVLVWSFLDAADDGDVFMVVDMVEAGMPVDIDDGGVTTLSAAAYYNRTDVVRCLLDKGANVNKQNRNDGETALHVASYYNYTDVMRMLLQHGARKDIKDNSGITPIDRARVCNNKEAVDLMEQY